MAIVMLPLILLFFMGVGLAYILYKPRTPRSLDEMDWGGGDDGRAGGTDHPQK